MRLNWFKHFVKKNPSFVWIFLLMIFIVSGWVFSYNDIKNNSKYAIGTTTDYKIKKGYQKETNYYFFLNDKKIDGYYFELLKNSKPIKVPNGKYLVVYSTRYPETNYLLVEKPILDTINIDSLNKIGVDENDIDWTKL